MQQLAFLQLDGDPPSPTRSLTISYHFHDSGRTEIVCLSLASVCLSKDTMHSFVLRFSLPLSLLPFSLSSHSH